MKIDVIVRGGLVIDGSGSPGVQGDVAVHDGRVVGVGDLQGEFTASRVIDAEGKVVSPGFVDAHTHMDAQVFWDKTGSSSAWHGVTTSVMGNCGFTLAPSRDHERELVLANLERAEDIPASAMNEGIDWTWSSFSEYMDAVEATPKGMNYATQIGHSAMRTFAMGERAFAGEGTEDDIKVMSEELRRAIAAGAYGFTTSRAIAHQTTSGNPVASRLASWDEVRQLAGVAAESGIVFQLAPEYTRNADGKFDEDVRDDFNRRLTALAVETKMPVMLPMLPIEGWEHSVQHLNETRAAGANMYGLAHSRGIGIVLSFQTRLPFDSLPEWKAVRSESLERQQVLLRDPDIRAGLLKAASAAKFVRTSGAEVPPPDYTNMFIMRSPYLPNPSVADEAARRGLHPVEVIIEEALATGLKQFFIQPGSPVDQRGLLEIMKHPKCLMTFSDNGAHVSQIVDCSIYTHFLSYWVRERNAFPLEQAIAMITRASAKAWGFEDRGLLQKGFAADINIFDPATIAPRIPEVVWDLPGGSRRLIQRADGFDATLVNGVVTLEKGESTGDYPGVLLRRKPVSA